MHKLVSKGRCDQPQGRKSIPLGVGSSRSAICSASVLGLLVVAMSREFGVVNRKVERISASFCDLSWMKIHRGGNLFARLVEVLGWNFPVYFIRRRGFGRSVVKYLSNSHLAYWMLSVSVTDADDRFLGTNHCRSSHHLLFFQKSSRKTTSGRRTLYGPSFGTLRSMLLLQAYVLENELRSLHSGMDYGSIWSPPCTWKILSSDIVPFLSVR